MVDVARAAVPVATVGATATPAEALEAAHAAKADFVVVEEAGRPTALLGTPRLASLERRASLVEVARSLPLVVVDAESDEARELALVLARAKVDALLVLDEDGGVVGALPAATVQRTLSLQDLSASTTKGDLYGDPMIDTETFVCQTCGSLRRPRGGAAPLCPRDRGHGRMVRVS